MKKIVYIFLIVIAWIGLVIVMIGSMPMIPNILKIFEPYTGPTFSHEPVMAGLGIIFLNWVTLFGLFLALLGGLIVRPRYFWFSAIIVGIISILGNIGESWYLYNYYEEIYVPLKYIIFLIPGLVFILEGILLKLIHHKRGNSNSRVGETHKKP